jgi:hypothetical protein
MYARLFYWSLYAFRHRLHRVDTILPLQLSQPRWISFFETLDDHPHKWDFWIQHRRSAEKEPDRAKQLYIRLTCSRAVTNRYAGEAQSPAPGTSHFGIGWDILEGRERSWGWVLGLSFCVWLFFCFIIDEIFKQTSLRIFSHDDLLPSQPCRKIEIRRMSSMTFTNTGRKRKTRMPKRSTSDSNHVNGRCREGKQCILSIVIGNDLRRNPVGPNVLLQEEM